MSLSNAILYKSVAERQAYNAHASQTLFVGILVVQWVVIGKYVMGSELNGSLSI